MSPEAFDKAQEADMQAQKEGKIFVMSGKILSVDLQQNPAAVECPKNGRIFTVAGPLSLEADLKAEGKTVRLRDFNEAPR
jgi:hypothetical protein